MIYFIAILAAFFGGLIGRAVAPAGAQRRLLAFLVPVCISTVLLCLPLLIETFRRGFPPMDWMTLARWCTRQLLILSLAGFATGFGWVCSCCIQNIFED